MIVIVDYGMGNVGSILNMIRRVGGNAVISSNAEEISASSAIILPGVGSFDYGISKLKSADFFDTLRDKVIHEKTPFLGICLGMQLLFERSEEGRLEGLGWIPGEVKKFDFRALDNRHLKIPHMGWNLVVPARYDPLFRDMEEDARFYFVHSFHAVCSESSHILATTNYGYDFPSSVRKDSIFATQFHPEKSHRFGTTLFKNFLEFV